MARVSRRRGGERSLAEWRFRGDDSRRYVFTGCMPPPLPEKLRRCLQGLVCFSLTRSVLYFSCGRHYAVKIVFEDATVDCTNVIACDERRDFYTKYYIESHLYFLFLSK